MHKKPAIIFVTLLLMIALTPAIFLPTDPISRKIGTGSDADIQFFTPVYFSDIFDALPSWIRAAVTYEVLNKLPQKLPSTIKNRAPPA